MESAKLRLWAKLIHTGRHDDYVTPPNIPLITGKTATPQKHRTDEIADVVAGAATAVIKAINQSQPQTPPKSCSTNDQHVKKISPLKVVTLRRSCLDDLRRVKDLYEENVLTNEEFSDEKQRILGMLKGLSQP